VAVREGRSGSVCSLPSLGEAIKKEKPVCCSYFYGEREREKVSVWWRGVIQLDEMRVGMYSRRDRGINKK